MQQDMQLYLRASISQQERQLTWMIPYTSRRCSCTCVSLCLNVRTPLAALRAVALSPVANRRESPSAALYPLLDAEALPEASRLLYSTGLVVSAYETYMPCLRKHSVEQVIAVNVSLQIPPVHVGRVECEERVKESACACAHSRGRALAAHVQHVM